MRFFIAALAVGSIVAPSIAAPLPRDEVKGLNSRSDYKCYTGDGSTATGWPAQKDWLPFEKAWQLNVNTVKSSCEWNNAGPNNSDNEMNALKAAIQDESKASQVPSELILAVMMQESGGCVRAPTTQYAHANPGLMQGSGQASCNSGTPQSPCPATTIRDMIHDGTAGSGDNTLKNSLDVFANVNDDSKWYKAVRRYNAGPNAQFDNLSNGPTKCYASDIANRLVSPFVKSGCEEYTISSMAINRVDEDKAPSSEKDKPSEPVLKTEQNNVPSNKGESAPDTHNTDPPATTGDSVPIMAGAASPCKTYYTVKSGDTCLSTGIDFAVLRQLNPSLNEQCTNLWAGYQYCTAT